MISVLGRANSLAPSLKTTSQSVVSHAKKIVPTSYKDSSSATVLCPLVTATNPLAYAGALPSGALKISSGLSSSTQVRHKHAVHDPSDYFQDHRRSDSKDPTVNSETYAVKKNLSTYVVTAGTIVPVLYVAKGFVRSFAEFMGPSRDIMAQGKIEIKTADIPVGKSMVFKWRGKPIFVKHRTADEISKEASVDVSQLRDPQADTDRVKDPEWLVVIGVCTHLGCIPVADAGDFGGYYCPCHGSHYDSSGRIRKGPAPLNLEVPEYNFPEPGLLVIG